MHMTVRTATENDVDGIRSAAKRSWAADSPEILTRETVTEGFDDWYAPERLAEEIGREQTLFLVEDLDDDVVGFTHAAWNDDDEGYVLRIYVDPDHRRNGVGHDLLVDACGALFEQGVERINAMVLSANDPGKAFYERFGFEFRDERETIIGDETYPESRYVLNDRAALDGE